MAPIYSFLQKIKMHESQHGIIMVITAYVLSIMMLALGSDIFYNIDTAAAGVNAETVEETKNLTLKTADRTAAGDTALAWKKQLINPYRLTGVSDPGQSIPVSKIETEPQNEVIIQTIEGSSDTVWLMGTAMDVETFDNLMVRMSSMVPEDGTAASEKDAAISVKDAGKNAGKDAAEKSDENEIKTFSVEVASVNKVITVTSKEVSMLERIVEAEASGEDMVGKILVVNVVFNRIADDEFPDSVKGVIFQHEHGDYQFSPVESGRYWDVKISEETKKAVQRALEGEDYSQGALYFIARKRSNSDSAHWFEENLDWLFKHGGHEFYK